MIKKGSLFNYYFIKFCCRRCGKGWCYVFYIKNIGYIGLLHISMTWYTIVWYIVPGFIIEPSNKD